MIKIAITEYIMKYNDLMDSHCKRIQKRAGTKAADGYGFNIAEIDEEQTARFYDVLTLIIERIKTGK